MKRIILLVMLLLSLCLFGQTKLKEKNENSEEKVKKTEQKQEINEEKKKVKNNQPGKEKDSKQTSYQKTKQDDDEKVFWQQSKKGNQIKTEEKRYKKPVNVDQIKQTKQWKHPNADSEMKPLKFKKHHHKPLIKIPQQQEIHYNSSVEYHYTIHPVFLYRGMWIRYYFIHDNGFFFYNGYPYYVYNNHIHRYSFDDQGFYDLVDSDTDEVYATFYGRNLKESYDRAAEIRDLMNNEEGYYRYFCAERFEYDPDYYYGWDPADFPDWYWE
ncbi:MAG: hypothetical protein K9N40_04405 [Candidatus Cloacimonetes bacterium]|nr:hypothetical protein [Candidatus Cloacimonadota bacterium]